VTSLLSRIKVIYDADWAKAQRETMAALDAFKAEDPETPWATLVPVVPGDPGPQMGLAVQAWSLGLTNVAVQLGFDVIHPDEFKTHVLPHLTAAAQGGVVPGRMVIWTSRPDVAVRIALLRAR